jgi:hypothetical protein
MFARLRPAVAGLPLLACGCQTPGFTVEDLGIPRTQRAIQAVAIADQTLLVSIFETKGDNRLALVDLPSGRVEERPLPGSAGADAIALDCERRVAYVASSNRSGVWRFDLDSRRLERIPAFDPLVLDERYVWSVAVGPRGTVYAGTYPGGLLLEYEPATGRARSLGPPQSGRQYVRDLAVAPSGTVYCRVGLPDGVVAVDPVTGSRRTLAAAPADAGIAQLLRHKDGEIRAAGCGPSSGAPDQAPPPPAVHVDVDGRYEVLGHGGPFQGRLDLSPRQGGMGVMDLAVGPDGHIYGATYYNASLFRVDPAEARTVPVGRVMGAPGEFRGLQDLGRGRLLVPGYHGQLYVHRVAEPWGAANPVRVGEIGHGQGLAMTADRDRHGTVALATPPGYGERGGGLTIIDPERVTWRTLRAPVPDQSVVSVAFGPGDHLFAGTSVESGLGASVTATVGHLIVVDPRSLKVVADVTPVPGATAVTAVAHLDGQRVLAGTDTGQLFTFDATTHLVRQVVRLPHVRELRRWPGTNHILGIGWRKGLFLVDRDTLAVAWIPGAPDKLLPGIAFDAAGRAYVHDGARIYRISPKPR